MPRLACALARLLTKDAHSPTCSIPGSPAPRKLSVKSKPAWRSSSVHGDSRTQQFKCPFTATNALTAVTKKEIDAYNSKEEIRSPSHSTLSTNKNHKTDEMSIVPYQTAVRDRRSLGVHLEHTIYKEEQVKEESADETIPEADDVEEEKETEKNECPSPVVSNKRRSSLKPTLRKNSCTLSLDVYKRRNSGVSVRPRLNSLSLVNAERLNELKEKFGTPDKVMHFFGRCFVKFFSNYGLVNFLVKIKKNIIIPNDIS